jgi:hypothetical protein
MHWERTSCIWNIRLLVLFGAAPFSFDLSWRGSPVGMLACHLRGPFASDLGFLFCVLTIPRRLLFVICTAHVRYPQFVTLIRKLPPGLFLSFGKQELGNFPPRLLFCFFAVFIVVSYSRNPFYVFAFPHFSTLHVRFRHNNAPILFLCYFMLAVFRGTLTLQALYLQLGILCRY